MVMNYAVDAQDWSFGSRVIRAWVPLTGTSSIPVVAAPGATTQIVVLGMEAISAVDCSLTITGFDTTERTPGSGSLIIPMLGKLMYNILPPDLLGLFRCTADTALAVTPSADSAGTGFVMVQYMLRRV